MSQCVLSSKGYTVGKVLSRRIVLSLVSTMFSGGETAGVRQLYKQMTEIAEDDDRLVGVLNKTKVRCILH